MYVKNDAILTSKFEKSFVNTTKKINLGKKLSSWEKAERQRK